MRCVVTGGAGFLGSHLVDRLLERGDRVVVIDNLLTGNWVNLEHHDGNPNLECLEQDASVSIDVDAPVDYVFHFASPASPLDFERHPIEVMRCGAMATYNCLDLCRKTGAKFLFASTSEVYGDPLITPQPETYWGNVNPIGVRSVYDEGKRYGEALTMAFYRKHRVDTRIVRFFNTFGPRMRMDDGRVVPNFITQALRGDPLTIYGSGDQTRSFGYAADSIEGVLKLAESDFHEPVNIGSEHERTIGEFAKLIIELTGSKSELVTLAALPDDPQQRRPDLTRARNLLGYRPQTSLEDGLRATVDYFRSKVDPVVS